MCHRNATDRLPNAHLDGFSFRLADFNRLSALLQAIQVLIKTATEDYNVVEVRVTRRVMHAAKYDCHESQECILGSCESESHDVVQKSPNGMLNAVFLQYSGRTSI